MFCHLVSFTWENLEILPSVCVHYTVTALAFVPRSTAVVVLHNLHNFLILRLWVGQVFKHMLTYGCFASHQWVCFVLVVLTQLRKKSEASKNLNIGLLGIWQNYNFTKSCYCSGKSCLSHVFQQKHLVGNVCSGLPSWLKKSLIVCTVTFSGVYYW